MNPKELLKISIKENIRKLEKEVSLTEEEYNINKYLQTYYKARLKELEKRDEKE